MADFAASDGLYVSERWRITGGKEKKMDDFVWLAQRLSGSTDSFLDVLLKESPYSDGWRITSLLGSADEEVVRRRGVATKSGDADAVELLSGIQEEFHRRVGDQVALESERQERLWAVLREEYCELPKPGYRPHCVISSKPGMQGSDGDNRRAGFTNGKTDGIPAEERNRMFFATIARLEKLKPILPPYSAQAHAKINAVRERCDALVEKAQREHAELMREARLAEENDYRRAWAMRGRAHKALKAAQEEAAVMMLDAQAGEYISVVGEFFPYQTLEILASTSIEIYGGEDAVGLRVSEWRARWWDRKASEAAQAEAASVPAVTGTESEARNSNATKAKDSAALEPERTARRWEDIEIVFTSELMVQIVVDSHPLPPQNYVEMGFENKKSRKPVAAWDFLLELARHDGVYRVAADRRQWTKIEKRIQELRKVLRRRFSLSDEPIPLIRKTPQNHEDFGYCTKFKIRCHVHTMPEHDV